RGRHEGIAKDTRRAREDERFDAGRRRLFEQVERTRYVGIDEVLTAVGRDMRLVQGGRMKNRPHAAQAAPHTSTVGDRADASREGTRDNVEANDVAPRIPQGADQRFAEMA